MNHVEFQDLLKRNPQLDQRVVKGYLDYAKGLEALGLLTHEEYRLTVATDLGWLGAQSQRFAQPVGTIV